VLSQVTAADRMLVTPPEPSGPTRSAFSARPRRAGAAKWLTLRDDPLLASCRVSGRLHTGGATRRNA